MAWCHNNASSQVLGSARTSLGRVDRQRTSLVQLHSFQSVESLFSFCLEELDICLARCHRLKRLGTIPPTFTPSSCPSSHGRTSWSAWSSVALSVKSFIMTQPSISNASMNRDKGADRDSLLMGCSEAGCPLWLPHATRRACCRIDAIN